jgi:hypothetical protein
MKEETKDKPILLSLLVVLSLTFSGLFCIVAMYSIVYVVLSNI